MPIETFNISLESTQNKEQYGTKITCTEVRKSTGLPEIVTTVSDFDE